MKPRKIFQLLILTLLFTSPTRGVETAFWQVGSFDEFLQGTLSNVSLDTEGALHVAPGSRVVFNPEEALALSLARDRKGNLYMGTGHQGKVFRIDAKQNSTLLFTAREPDVFALAVGPDGSLYVGSSPEGKVYRITPDGQSKVFYDPGAKYIWALTLDAQGRLYVATGDKGQIFRVDPAGKAELFFDSKQTHIMCLTLEKDGNLLAGSVPRGLIYRITPQGKAFIIYEATLPEIHDLVTDSGGRIYAAALGGAGGKGSPEFLVPSTPEAVPGGVTTVTVTASEENHAATTSEAQKSPGDASSAPSFNRPAPLPAVLPNFQIPQGRGALIEILPDSTTETIWSSNNESIFGLAVRGNHVLFSTDSNGRIFDMVPEREAQKVTLLTETHESLATLTFTWQPATSPSYSGWSQRLLRKAATSPPSRIRSSSPGGECLLGGARFPPGQRLSSFHAPAILSVRTKHGATGRGPIAAPTVAQSPALPPATFNGKLSCMQTEKTAPPWMTLQCPI
jgi:sugar lactone lactonase YvrE